MKSPSSNSLYEISDLSTHCVWFFAQQLADVLIIQYLTDMDCLFWNFLEHVVDRGEYVQISHFNSVRLLYWCLFFFQHWFLSKPASRLLGLFWKYFSIFLATPSFSKPESFVKKFILLFYSCCGKINFKYMYMYTFLYINVFSPTFHYSALQFIYYFQMFLRFI